MSKAQSGTGVWSDEMAIWYVEQWGEHPMHNKVVELCQIDKHARVFDIGCGSGPVVRRFARYLTQGEVIGIDPSSKMIELAEQQTQSSELNVAVDYRQSAVEQLPCENNTVDLVVAVNSLHHWQNVPKGLSEIQRVLNAKGKLVLIDELWDEMPEFEKPEGAEHQACDQLAHYKDLNTVIATLKTAGFTQIDKQFHRSPDVAVSVLTVKA